MNITEFQKSTKVVIIDDNLEEGNTIKIALESKKIPATFYHIDSDDKLPVAPLANARVIFLDLNFSESSHLSNPRQVAGIALAKLSKFITRDSFYILIIWSSHTTQDAYTNFCEQLARDADIQKPIKIFPLDKNIGSDADTIIDQINLGFNDLKLFSIFTGLEEMVNNAVTKSLSSLLPGELNTENLSKILNSLAIAYSGEIHPSKSTPKDALWSFTGVVSDNMSREIAKSDFGELHSEIHSDIDTNQAKQKIILSNNEKAKINEKLTFSRDLSFSPGIIYSESTYFSFNSNKVSDDDKEGIVINITPLCDHAQGKRKYDYYIHGVILTKADGVKPKLKDGRPSSICQLGSNIMIGEKESMIIIDLTSKFSTEVDSRKSDTPIHKLRDSLVIDIQHKVATHQSRPGHILL